jgi:glycyl-tRNA synthetase
MILCDAYREEEVGGEQRAVLKFHPEIAPYTAAVFPLVKKEGMPDVAHRIEEDLRKQFNVFYDEKGSVGKRYRRQDEIGTPFCITVDGDTLEDDTVTIRDRDSMEQDRIPAANVRRYIEDCIEGWKAED